jgi:hypothetical protein
MVFFALTSRKYFTFSQKPEIFYTFVARKLNINLNFNGYAKVNLICRFGGFYRF